MSPANSRRFVVKAFDYEEWAVVVEAAGPEDAIRKAEAIYNADSFGFTNGSDIGWKAQPLATEVRQ
jgi:hypothetical protein